MQNWSRTVSEVLHLCSFSLFVLPVPGALDSMYKWWTTLTSSLLVSVFVVVVSVFVTFKAARWRRRVLIKKTDRKEQRSKVKMESLASWDKTTLKSQRSNPLN